MRYTIIAKHTFDIPDDKLMEYGYSSNDPNEAFSELLGRHEDDPGASWEELADRCEDITIHRG